MGTEEEGKQRYLKGFFQSICLDYPDLFGQFAGEVMALCRKLFWFLWEAA